MILPCLFYSRTIVEDPTQYQAAAEVSVDVLFAAFENFLNHAWRHKMGRLLPEPILNKLEHIFRKYHAAWNCLGLTGS